MFSRFLLQRRLEETMFELKDVSDEKIKLAEEHAIKCVKFKSLETELCANWMLHEASAPSVFILHGNGENIGDWLHAQLLLKKMGFNSFVFDYAGFGMSEGKPSVDELDSNASYAWKYFCELSSESYSRTALGHSLGAAVLLSSLKKYSFFPDKIVLHGAYTSVRDISVHLGENSKPLSRFIPDVWNNLKTILKVQQATIQIVHSKDDEIVPYEMGARIAQSRNDIKLLSLESYSHNQLFTNPDKAFWGLILDKES